MSKIIDEVVQDTPDIIGAAEDIAAAVSAVGSPASKVDLVTRIEAAMQDLLKHVAALISHHS